MVTVIDRFTYPLSDRRPDLDIGATLAKGYKDDIREITCRVKYINSKYQHPITLTFYGNGHEGMRCVVDRDDEETKKVAIAIVAQFFQERNKL
ncbi:MAG: hypothetical protein EOO61_13830 [Hymenobacter sp.]|nr:MAG: hypothetical protein EOO61_13830 [Hymenobacter sp.]